MTPTRRCIELVALDQRGAVERVAPFDTRGILGVQKHVHSRKRRCRAVHFLPIQREVFRADLLGSADQQRAGTAGGIADRVARLRRGEPRVLIIEESCPLVLIDEQSRFVRMRHFCWASFMYLFLRATAEG